MHRPLRNSVLYLTVTAILAVVDSHGPNVPPFMGSWPSPGPSSESLNLANAFVNSFGPFGPSGPQEPQNVPIRRLNEPCQVSVECEIAFSFCMQGRCVCHAGFAEINGFCEPQVASCAGSEPLRNPMGQLVKCAIRVKPGVPAAGLGVNFDPLTSVDTCPPGYRCAMPGYIWDALLLNDQSFPGICCQSLRRNGRCQFGLPDLTKHCDYRRPQGYCGHTSHSCEGDDSTWLGGGMNFNDLFSGQCCPSICSAGAFALGPYTGYANGRCLRPTIDFNQPCEFTPQCKGGTPGHMVGCIAAPDLSNAIIDGPMMGQPALPPAAMSGRPQQPQSSPFLNPFQPQPFMSPFSRGQPSRAAPFVNVPFGNGQATFYNRPSYPGVSNYIPAYPAIQPFG